MLRSHVVTGGNEMSLLCQWHEKQRDRPWRNEKRRKQRKGDHKNKCNVWSMNSQRPKEQTGKEIQRESIQAEWVRERNEYITTPYEKKRNNDMKASKDWKCTTQQNYNENQTRTTMGWSQRKKWIHNSAMRKKEQTYESKQGLDMHNTTTKWNENNTSITVRDGIYTQKTTHHSSTKIWKQARIGNAQNKKLNIKWKQDKDYSNCKWKIRVKDWKTKDNSPLFDKDMKASKDWKCTKQ